MEPIQQILGDVGYGAAIGGALGLTGTGGSILAVPAVVCLVGEDVHTIIGTSLAVVGGIAAECVLGQQRTVRWDPGLQRDWNHPCSLQIGTSRNPVGPDQRPDADIVTIGACGTARVSDRA